MSRRQGLRPKKVPDGGYLLPYEQGHNTVDRPSKLLNTSSKRLTDRSMYKSNASTSPLLRLPAEIRNKIWTMVLGQRVIHTYRQRATRRGRTFGCSVCQAQHLDSAVVDLAIHAAKEQSPRTIKPYAFRHSSCKCVVGDAAAQIPLRLDLLLVCAQVYQEAALIPFHHNTFAIARPHWVIESLFKSLIPAQFRAIRAMHGLPEWPRVYTKLWPNLQEAVFFCEKTPLPSSENADELDKEWTSKLLECYDKGLEELIAKLELQADDTNINRRQRTLLTTIVLSRPDDEESWRTHNEMQIILPEFCSVIETTYKA